MARVPPLAPLLLAAVLVLASSCGAQRALPLSHNLDAPTTYRVGAVSTARFSGPVSDKAGETRVTAAFRATPVSEGKVEVETLYFAASVEDADGEPAALSLGALAGTTVTVELGPGGQVGGVTGDRELLEAPVPLVSVRALVEGLFPPLPGEAMERGDTWNGAVPVPFPSVAEGPPVETRYVLSRVRGERGFVDGYEISSYDRGFSPSGAGDVSGRGRLDYEFVGDYERGTGYVRTETTARFDTSILRLGPGNTYANGNAHLEQTVTTERLSTAEAFGLDLRE